VGKLGGALVAMSLYRKSNGLNMKHIHIISTVLIIFIITNSGCYQMDNSEFKSKKVLRTATITVEGKIEIVFPLFGAFEEKKWAKGWNPVLIYPEMEIIEEGTTFKTEGHGHGESEFIWRVSKYEPEKFLIQYLVTTENRYWTITVKCKTIEENKTSADITYSFIGLNEIGNKINEHSLSLIYKNDLKDWEEEINNYLKKLSSK